MKKYYFPLFFIVLLAVMLFSSTNTSVKTNSIDSKVSLSNVYGKIPLYFIKNKGQVNEKALFYSRTKDYTLWITEKGLLFDKVYKNEKKTKREVLRMNLIKPEKKVRVELGKVEEYRINYFKGNDKRKWKTGIETSKEVIYKGIYKNIDLRIYGKGNLIEYDWVVKRGGNPKDIEFEYKGSNKIKIDRQGNIVINTDFGKIVHKRPYSYQVIEGKKIEIESRYYKIGKNRFGIRVGKYDKNHPLIIDPISLVYSTYLGGSSKDYGRAIAVDSLGYAYITGETYSNDFPIKNEYQTDQNFTDLYITKLSKDGSSLEYSTYIGGLGNDYGNGIAVDSNGYVYVTGYTDSSNYPTINEYQINKGGRDAFITKLAQDGSTLVYSTYLGGDSYDYGFGIAVDSEGYAYITGYTYSTDFPTKNPCQIFNNGKYDVFITKLAQDGSNLVYSTYLGGSNEDYARAIAVDSQGYAYITGYTYSSDFPKLNFYQNYQDNADAFVAKLAQDGSTLVYSTYLGGSDYDEGYGIAVDSQDYAYVTGYTSSSNFPTENAYQSSYNGYNDAFITKLSQNGKSLVYSTYLGGSDYDEGYGIAVDSQDYAYVTGYTYSNNFPTKNPYQDDQGYSDVFITKLAQDGKSLEYSTYLGGGDDDYGWGIAVDSQGSAYVTGETSSTDFPTKSPYQSSNNNDSRDAFITKFSISSDLSIKKTVDNTNPLVGENITYTITITNNGQNDAGSIIVEDNLPSELLFVSSNPSQGTYNHQTGLWNVGSLLNGSTATLTITVKVNQGGTITNTASITNSDVPDPDTGNNSASVDIKAEYLIEAKVEGGNGNVSPSTQRVAHGGTATINITPDTGYEIESIMDNGVSKPISNPYKIINVKENHTVVVKFKKISYTINARVDGGGGSVSPSYQTVIYGGTATINISPNTGYEIESITDNGETKTISNPYKITNVSENHTVVVKFKRAVRLTLSGEKKTERAWIIRRDYGKLNLSVDDPGEVGSKFVIQKSIDRGGYQEIKTLNSSDISGGSYTYYDKYLEKGKTYKYRFIAYDSTGTILAVSNEIEL